MEKGGGGKKIFLPTHGRGKKNFHVPIAAKEKREEEGDKDAVGRRRDRGGRGG